MKIFDNVWLLGCITLLTLAFGVIVNGLAISLLWDWFIVPLGVRSITLVHGIGISILAQAIIKPDLSAAIKKGQDTDNWTEALTPLFVAAFGPLWAIFTGWCVALFV